MANYHGTPTADMVAADLPDGVEPVDGPVNEGGYIDAAPPGTDHDAGSSDTISGTVAGAVALAFANLAEHEAYSRTAGSTMGDVMPLPHGPDTDETILGYVSEPKNIGGLGMGLTAS